MHGSKLDLFVSVSLLSNTIFRVVCTDQIGIVGSELEFVQPVEEKVELDASSAVCLFF